MSDCTPDLICDRDSGSPMQPAAPSMAAREVALFVVRAAGPGDRWTITHEQSGKMCTASVKSFAVGLARNWARRARPSRLVVWDAENRVESEDEYTLGEAAPARIASA